MFNSTNNTPFTMPVMPATGGYGNDGAFSDGGFKRKVLIHELCHAVCMSYNIHIPLEQEEFLCDFVATYGDEVFDIVDMMFGAMQKTA